MTRKTAFSESIFFIGIAGMGMSSIAEVAKSLGKLVLGSDTSDSATVAHLRSLGIKIFDQHHASNIESAKTVVYSSAIPESNPELIRARQLGLTVVHRSEYLAHLADKKRLITVTGTHGKTTTTALISHMLIECGLDPTCLVGGIVHGWNSTARVGKSNIWVVEADESDGSFLRYRPQISVVTNVDLDHIDHYGSVEKLHNTFRDYLANSDPDGCNVVCWEDPVLRTFLPGQTQRLGYGFRLGSDVRAIEISSDKGVSNFRAIVERDAVDVSVPLIGKHNILNCLAALSVAQVLEVNLDQAGRALGRFPGVMRRFDRLLQSDVLTIIDDYAHNPGKIEAVIGALKLGWPQSRLVVVFQPHRFSRLRTTFSETVDALSSADVLVLLPVYTAGEPYDPALSKDMVLKRFQETLKCDVLSADSLEDAHAACASLIKDNTMTVIATIGAGDVWKVSHSLKETVTALT